MLTGLKHNVGSVAGLNAGCAEPSTHLDMLFFDRESSDNGSRNNDWCDGHREGNNEAPNNTSRIDDW